jgi:Domain of unknown function (DUF2019)
MKSKEPALSDLTEDALLQRFATLTQQHGDAIYHWETSRANRIFPHIQAVVDELQSRENDKRTDLLRLYDHPNVFVRLNAARYTLAVAPEVACRALQTIAESKDYPASAEAGMSIHAFVSGINKPA